jgi:hypothetical protein
VRTPRLKRTAALNEESSVADSFARRRLRPSNRVPFFGSPAISMRAFVRILVLNRTRALARRSSRPPGRLTARHSAVYRLIYRAVHRRLIGSPSWQGIIPLPEASALTTRLWPSSVWPRQYSS